MHRIPNKTSKPLFDVNYVFTDVVQCARLLFIPSLLFRVVLGVVQSRPLGCTCVTYKNIVSIKAWYNRDLYRSCFYVYLKYVDTVYLNEIIT